MKKKTKIESRRSSNRMVHTAVVLPVSLIAQLKADAEKSSGGMSTEIRERLQQTYRLQAEPHDFPTNELLSAIRNLAHSLDRDLGSKWHQHPYALSAFRAGMMEFLARYHPQGDVNVRPDTPPSGGPSDPAEIVGRIHARLIGIAGHETEESYDPVNDYDETDPDLHIEHEPASSRKKLKD